MENLIEVQETLKEFFGQENIKVIYSPHPKNKNGNYFIDNDPCPFIRSWETIIYEGKPENFDPAKIKASHL